MLTLYFVLLLISHTCSLLGGRSGELQIESCGVEGHNSLIFSCATSGITCVCVFVCLFVCVCVHVCVHACVGRGGEEVTGLVMPTSHTPLPLLRRFRSCDRVGVEGDSLCGCPLSGRNGTSPSHFLQIIICFSIYHHKALEAVI